MSNSSIQSKASKGQGSCVDMESLNEVGVIGTKTSIIVGTLEHRSSSVKGSNATHWGMTVRSQTEITQLSSLSLFDKPKNVTLVLFLASKYYR